MPANFGAIRESSGPYRFDVFLSFHGEDMRNGFTGHLQAALDQRGIVAFIDDEELGKGEEIAPAILGAIGESRISIVVFSENYASSSWCLDELVRIVECRDTMGQIVWPVFYKVDPSEVRRQRGRYGQALVDQEERLESKGGDPEKVKRWREALTTAANISGWHLVKERESDVIQSIVKRVWDQLNHKQLHVPENVVAMNSHVAHMRSLLDMESSEVRMVGICGLGGIGKTTIAKATYNAIAHKFECCSFLSNVKETCETSTDSGLLQLQETLISQVMWDDALKLHNVLRGSSMIKSRLCKKKVLIIIDDVNELVQLETLVGGCDWFGCGRRIIITTRDERLLAAHHVKIVYKVQPLNRSSARTLFSSIVFSDSSHSLEYEKLSHSIVDYTKGLPLAITVLGSFLRGRSLLEWKGALDKLKRAFNGKIFNVLRISFEGLDDHERDIFLDITCFFKGESVSYVKKILDSCDLCPDIGIAILMDKSVITIESGKLEMHDMIQEMGREIVRKESPKEPGGRIRLWFFEDVLHVLTEGTLFKCLRFVNFSRCTLLSKIPDVSSLPNLESLDLQECTNLVEVHQSLGSLDRLIYLNFLNCHKLSSFPSSLKSRSLENLILRGCSKLSRFPDILVRMEHLKELSLHGTAIGELPSSVVNLIELKGLYLEDCTDLKNLPCSIYTLQHLERIFVDGCSQLSKFPECLCESSDCTNVSLLSALPNVINLNVQRCSLLELSFLKNLHCMSSLTILDLSENKFVNLAPPHSNDMLSC
ncbi:hypothetical protein BT93_L4622 [Corymbia citriodora subsp. variegata]|uniref:TIR domain-containing protein n=1 Tax=Corymbia citriodora subsp. variegata TaxID=360336 RepID=A0A8T0CY51_CORYI|nr:hypothetical protein BT93_L4622 [Corymbia citriodora subsp. variegata]